MLAGQVIDPETYVARADLLVLPSHAEGLPLVILEAASLGVPSLLSDIAVHRELARMGLGKTFRRHDFRDFADKARELAAERDPGSDAARRIVWSQMFAPDKGFEKYESIVLDSQD
jgi:glycosyltransferase involved in cell wall biosynthesis